MTDVRRAEEVSRLFSDIDGLTEADCRVLQERHGWSRAQCGGIRSALSNGPDGYVSAQERLELGRLGFSENFITGLAGSDGLAAIRSRAQALAVRAQRGPLPGRLGALRELQNIFFPNSGPRYSDLVPALNDAVLPPFHALVGSSTESAVREGALRLLTWLADSRSGPVFQSLLSDPDPSLRALAAGGLGRLRAQATIPDLVRALRDVDPRVRANALRALARIQERPRTVLPYLLEAALTDTDPLVRRSAFTGMGELGLKTPTVDAAFRAAQHDPDPLVRRSAVAALLRFSGLGDEDFALVLRFTRDRSPEVRETAAWVLGRLNSPRDDVVTALQSMLQDGSSHVRRAAERALRRLGR